MGSGESMRLKLRLIKLENKEWWFKPVVVKLGHCKAIQGLSAGLHIRCSRHQASTVDVL